MRRFVAWCIGTTGRSHSESCLGGSRGCVFFSIFRGGGDVVKINILLFERNRLDWSALERSRPYISRLNRSRLFGSRMGRHAEMCIEAVAESLIYKLISLQVINRANSPHR